MRPGVYHEGLVIDKALDIIGDGALEEIIVSATASSCLVMQTSAAAAVRNLTLRGRARGGAGAAQVAGFFAVDIPHGRLLLEGCDISSDSLSCVAIHNATAEPTIRRCRIHHGADSGVYAFDAAGGILEACDIFENANIGVAVTSGARTSVSGCHVHHGGDAGIVVWQGAANAIEDCDIYLNAKTNVGASDKGQTTLRRCRIHEGHNTGVFVHRDGRAALEECNIYRHPEAEVAATSGGDVRLRNCRIHQGRRTASLCAKRGRCCWKRAMCCITTCPAYVDAGGVGVARSCRINENNHVGVSCEAGGAVTVEDSELRGNRVAAWQTHHGSLVDSRNNRV
ncbi:MAG: right-handed parallel beta-helix repeat-containing protein [Pyrinomonadaceae bacterium]